MSMNEVGKKYERPWGTYETLRIEDNYQVKLVIVHPQGRLSLQKHFRRSEHWVVVSGSPTFTVHNQTRVYEINESVFITVNTLHRIENFTNDLCKIIEVQVGDYLGEDDIVRVEDIYGR